MARSLTAFAITAASALSFAYCGGGTSSDSKNTTRPFSDAYSGVRCAPPPEMLDDAKGNAGSTLDSNPDSSVDAHAASYTLLRLACIHTIAMLDNTSSARCSDTAGAA